MPLHIAKCKLFANGIAKALARCFYGALLLNLREIHELCFAVHREGG